MQVSRVSKIALFSLTAGIFLSPISVMAFDTTDLDKLAFDSSIITEDKNFTTPTQIIVVPLNLKSEASVTASEWFKGIYYYTVDVLGFPDIPFHHIVSQTGEVYTGNRGGVDHEVVIDGIEGSSLVIGYLNKTNAGSIDAKAEKALAQLLLKLCNENTIVPNKISISGLKFKKNDEAKTVNLVADNVVSTWQTSLTKVVNLMRDNYAPQPKEYKVELAGLTLPTEEITPGEEVIGALKLRNTGTNGFYKDANSELLLTKLDGNTSTFYLNNSWASQSQSSIMKEDQVLLPGEEQEFEVKLKAPLHIGEKSEIFGLKTVGGVQVSIQPFDIKLKIKRIDKQIVEIKNNSAGFVNVYSTPSNNASVVRRVSPGERFFLLELNEQTLWAQIDLGGGVSGYLAAWQFSYL